MSKMKSVTHVFWGVLNVFQRKCAPGVMLFNIGNSKTFHVYALKIIFFIITAAKSVSPSCQGVQLVNHNQFV